MNRLAWLAFFFGNVGVCMGAMASADSVHLSDTLSAVVYLRIDPGDYTGESEPPDTNWGARLRSQTWVLRSMLAQRTGCPPLIEANPVA